MRYFHVFTSALCFFQVFMNGRIIGWWIVTTGMITAVPLLFEVSGLAWRLLCYGGESCVLYAINCILVI